MRRFLIDTDTASDDAVALVMALRHPAVAVEAVTVVAGNVGLDQAVQNALYTVELCGSDTPVHAGAAGPLMRDLETAQVIHGEDGMGDCGLFLEGRTPTPGRAVDVIVDTILGSPGEVTLVALGPLTNVATSLARAPEIVDAVDRVVIMGGTGLSGAGNVTPLAEYNFWADPEAARMVLRSGLNVELVGWDVSMVSACLDERREAQVRAIGTRFSDFALAIQARVAALFAEVPAMAGPCLPDPIAMAHAIDPIGAETSWLPVAIIAGDGPGRGVMEVDRMGVTRAAPNANVVTHYPSDRFFAMLAAALAE